MYMYYVCIACEPNPHEVSSLQTSHYYKVVQIAFKLPKLFVDTRK